MYDEIIFHALNIFKGVIDTPEARRVAYLMRRIDPKKMSSSSVQIAEIKQLRPKIDDDSYQAIKDWWCINNGVKIQRRSGITPPASRTSDADDRVPTPARSSGAVSLSLWEVRNENNNS